MDSTLTRRMMMESEASRKDKFVPALLPWLVAAGALVVYLITLNRWVSLSSLQQVASVSGWTWQPEVYGPLFWLVTYPFRWLPAQVIPLALNSFAAVCAALSLALLARSVALLPHDRTDEQRRQGSGQSGILTIPAAWLPPVLAALVCGLQLTFWEYATAVSSPPPPWGSGCEMLDLLFFSYVLRCLLEFRVAERESWLLRACLAFGAAITNNWAMIGFFPAFLLALVWIKGLGFFNLRFLTRASLCGAVGLLLYLLLPILQGLSDSALPFWPTLKANLNSQRGILMMFYKYGRQEVALLALTSLVPVFIMGIRWASYFGDTSKLGVALATFMFHVVHALFLVACIWVALDPPFSPRNKGFGSPFLTFYYLGALVVGYCSGYFLLVFGGESDRPRRVTPPKRLIKNLVTFAVWLLLVLPPGILIYRNLPQIRATNGPMLKHYTAQMAEALPAKHAVLLSDDPRRLYLLHAYTALSKKDRDYLFLDTSSLVYPDYHRFLKRQYPQVWESNPPKGLAQRAEPFLLVQLISRLAQTNSIYYLHPSFGYYFEFFYPESHGLVYKLVPYPTNSLLAPLPGNALIAQNESFWERADARALQPLLSVVEASTQSNQPGFMDILIKQLHLAPQSNRDAITLAAFYSRALDYWGVELQKCGQLTNAAAHFERALALNPDNLVAQVNLECNRNLQAGRRASVQVSKSIEDEFGKYRNWDQIMGDNGPFDEPNFCFEQGRVFVNNNLYRQAAAQFDRVRVLGPENLIARIWLAQLYVISQLPGEALKLIERIRAQPDLLDAARTNRTELLYVETSAHLAQGDLRGAEATVQSALAKYPNDTNVLATATQVFMNSGRYSNALNIIEQELKFAPTNMNALVNKGYACIQVGAFEQAIPPLTKVLTMDTNNYSALLNRAIASLRADQLEPARRDYEVLQKAFPTAFQIYFGLGEIAWRMRDTNAAVRYYQLYLVNAPTNIAEAKLVSARLEELKPGSP
ncbi:MAG TPA: tetratricopeptide repeat protein [Candidatus Paceibacterota bacterium]|nr:tetratricopeptide repeat protein [Verrucomicrobiota bacterium]HSA10200.1 tetratricopeptide repeat protein [Candidatus Paceibacterota bacterium]